MLDLQALPVIRIFLLGLFLFLSPATTYAASLITGDAPAPASADLTATGTSDWVHWGLTSASSVDRKAGVTPQISSFTTIGGTARRYSPPAGARVNFTWSDGTPTTSAATTTGVYLQGVGNRFELSVPTDTVAKTLTLYAGGFKARGRLDFSLSDGSASPASIIIDNPNGVIDREVTISFAAASAGQSLRISYTLLDDYGVGGNITLAGAALAGGGSTPPTNQPPTLATIGNKAVTAGQRLSFPVSATDPDGPTPLILTGAPLPAGATFTDNGGGNGQFDWTPSESDVAASPYSVTFTATDDNGTGLSSAETIQITVNSSAGGSGSLITGDAPAPASADLTATGTSDWIHWGLTSASSVDRKAGVTPQISSFTTVGGTAKRYSPPTGARVNFTWSDGTPTTSAATTTGVYLQGVGNRFELSVPTDTVAKTLTLYAGGFKARGRLDFSLSDGSASPASIIIDNPNGVIDREVTISFAAASAGQSLRISYTLLDDYGVGGNITLAGAALAGGGSTPPTNQPPTLATIGNKAVTAGQRLSFPVSATDPDGPTPLILTGAPLPAGATFTDNGGGNGQFDWTPSESDVAASPYSVTFTATDDNGTGLSSAETIQITVNSSAGGSGSLITGDAPAPASADLTATGTSDWIHWGLTSASSVDRKAGVTPQISSFTTVGGTAKRYSPPTGARVNFTWSDGTPTTSAATTTGVYLQGVGNRFELSVPTDTVAKTLTLYAGGFKARGRLDFSLSDGSASPASIIIDNPNGVIDREVTISFAAASAGQSLRISYTLLDDYGVGGNITLAGAALAGGGSTPPISLPFTENFADTLDNWIFVDETDLSSSWAIVSGELHQQNRVESVNAFDQSYHLGTFGYLSDGQALTDYTLTVDALYLSNGLAEDIGVMFRYQDSNNYYRLALNSRYGFTRLEKKVGGQFTPLATNARGYMAGELLQIKIETAGSSIKIYLNGDPLFAVTDSSLASGTIALYTQDNAKFDNVLVDTNATTPTVVIASPIAHSVMTGASLQVTASAENVPVNGFVEFILDDSTSLTDNTAPFTRTFTSVGAGTHKVDAILRNQANVEVARDTNVDIATQGDYMVAVGDSISNGIGDNYAADNLAMFGRIIAFQGFEAPLTDKLNVNEAFANNLVANEGVGGDESFDAAFTRIDSILVRHPETNQTLILLGTNDALSIIPPGLGCTGTGCDGTFKGNLQTLVDKIIWLDYPTNTVPSNIMPVVSLTPPVWNSSDPWNSTTNNRIRNYNTVITTELSGITVGADLFSHFLPSATSNYSSLFADNLHPNGLGTEVTSCLLYNAINAASPLPLPFVLDDLTASTSAAPKQNLLEAGDQYYLDASFTLTSVPAVLQTGRWIMPANADRTNASGTHLSFTTDRAVDVYIAYDDGATVLPNWMSGYTDTGLLIGTTDPLTPNLRLYTMNFPAGAIVLGGNLQGSAAGANSNYVAIVVAM